MCRAPTWDRCQWAALETGSFKISPALHTFPGIAGSFGDPLQTLMARTYFGGIKRFWLQALGNGCICSLQRLYFSFAWDLKDKAAADCCAAGKAGAWLAPTRAVCDGDEQRLEKSLISPLVSFLPPPGHPVNLETTLPCAELGPALCKPLHCGDPGSSSSVPAGTRAKPRLVSAAQGHALKIKLQLGGTSGWCCSGSATGSPGMSLSVTPPQGAAYI